MARANSKPQRPKLVHPAGTDLAAQCHLGRRPRNDDGYFEEMTKVIFRVGFSREVVEKKWPAFRSAFAGFAIDTVAGWGGRNLERLMDDAGLVRNERKLRAVLRNAQIFREIRAEQGSFARYLAQEAKAGEAALCRTLSKRFSFLGGRSVLYFLRSVGEEMPETLRALGF